jgi:hypothetical protein
MRPRTLPAVGGSGQISVPTSRPRSLPLLVTASPAPGRVGLVTTRSSRSPWRTRRTGLGWLPPCQPGFQWLVDGRLGLRP